MQNEENKIDKLIINSRPLRRVGAPKGNQNARKGKNKVDGGKVKKRMEAKTTSGGNSREYWIGRLKRDAPLHLALLKDGVYKTVAEAVRRSGLKKKPLPKSEQIFRDVEKLGITDLEHLIYLTETRIKALEKKLTPHKIAKALHKKFAKEGNNIIYTIYYDDKKPYYYMSQDTKLINYQRKYKTRHKPMAKCPDTDEFNHNSDWMDNLTNFAAYTKGDIKLQEYEEWIRKHNMPRIHRIIMPVSDKNTFGDLLDPNILRIYDYSEQKQGNVKRLYFNAIQDFLDMV